MRKHIGILIFIIGFAGLQADLNVTEYVKLLTEKITACSSFKLPTNNSEETKTNSNSVKRKYIFFNIITNVSIRKFDIFNNNLI